MENKINGMFLYKIANMAINLCEQTKGPESGSDETDKKWKSQVQELKKLLQFLAT